MGLEVGGAFPVLGVYFVMQNIGTQSIVLGFILQSEKERERK